MDGASSSNGRRTKLRHVTTIPLMQINTASPLRIMLRGTSSLCQSPMTSVAFLLKDDYGMVEQHKPQQNHLLAAHVYFPVDAIVLGVRREGITEAAGNLQKKGAIEYGRGRITVLDRRVIEKLSCECYSVVRKETDRLMPFPTGQVALASP